MRFDTLTLLQVLGALTQGNCIILSVSHTRLVSTQNVNKTHRGLFFYVKINFTNLLVTNSYLNFQNLERAVTRTLKRRLIYIYISIRLTDIQEHAFSCLNV